MHNGNFPPATVPSLPDDFKYWDGQTEVGGDDEEQDGSDCESEEGSVDLNHTGEMDDREMDFYLEMYDS